MTRNLAAMFLLAATGLFGQYRGGYDRVIDPRYDARYDDRYDHRYGYGYGGEVYQVRMAPPVGYRYGGLRPPCPSPRHVWVDGFWNWNRGRYHWTNGYWARPPIAGGFWVAPRYDRGRFYAGFWSGSRGPGWYRQGGRR